MVVKRYIWNYLLILIFSFLGVNSSAQEISSSFEIRYFTKDMKANGETDFKGETSIFDTEQRIRFLTYYANEVSAYYGDKDLNTEVAPDNEVKSLMTSIKPQPLPEVRTRIPLEEWRWLSSLPGQYEKSLLKINKYKGATNMHITNGTMNFHGDGEWKWDFPVQTWRFSMIWKIYASENASANFYLRDNASLDKFAGISLANNSLTIQSAKSKTKEVEFSPNEWHEVKIESDLEIINGHQHYNVYLDGKQVADYIPAVQQVDKINTLQVTASKEVLLDDFYGVGYQKTTDDRYPYYPMTFLDENFDVKPIISGWQKSNYTDYNWNITTLPFGQGGERYEGEDLYFRKKVDIKQFKRAYLNIEALDPGGEIWINGQLAAMIDNRYPIRLDVTEYLKPYTENQIALKINSFYLSPSEGVRSPHTYLDNNPTWFAGRASLDLTEETFVNDAFLYTESLEKTNAHMKALVSVEHRGTLGFKGKIKIKMNLWNDDSEISHKVIEQPILIGPGVEKVEFKFPFKNPKLWDPASPNLYKVTVEVENKDGVVIDDYVFTSGIRTISQKGGIFHLNGKPAMLNGTQLMGFRAPLENMMAQLRCPSNEWVAKEMLMTQKMNCNMLRIHVHGWKEKAIGVNDSRYCELADQMGIMLIMCPPSWIREGDWGQIDFEGYHKYMKLLQNHPSIVMWEVSNHPNTFNENPAYESDLFTEKAYNAVYPYDSSRLISITSHIAHLNYGNDEGTVDKRGRVLSKDIEQAKKADPGNQTSLNPEIFDDKVKGEEIKATKAWTAPMVTRGNQDAPTGYGNEWSVLRKWPTSYYQSFLQSKERAYFNFEHQESIGQPNWNLCKGKPWYNLQSYEWDYDEGSIGRKLQQTEWRESQAWQAFSAYESIKKMRQLGYDGFSWCSLHGGANAATYKKPAIDFLGYGKLVFHIHKTVFQPVLAGSNNVDVVYGPNDLITPMILNLGEERHVKLTVQIKHKYKGEVIDKKVYENVHLKEGRSVNELEPFKPTIKNEGLYFIEYLVD